MDFVTELLSLFRPVLPYLVMAYGAVPVGIMIALQVLDAIASRLVKWFRKRPRHTEVLTAPVPIPGYEDRNLLMIRVVWYIKEVIGAKGDIVYSMRSQSAGSGGDIVADYEIYSLDGVLEVGNGIEISCNSVREKSSTRREIWISGPDESSVRAFIDKCSIAYIEYYENRCRYRRHTTRHIHEPKIDTRGLNNWQGVPCRVNKTFDNVFLNDSVLTLITNDLNKFRMSRSLYVSNGIPYKRGYLFHGPPGTGKSSIWHAISSTLGADVYRLNLSIAASRAEFKELCWKIPPGSVVVVDDIDRIKIVSGDEPVEDETKSKTKKPSVDKQLLLEIFDGYECLDGCVIVFTSNDVSKIDPVLIRSGRMDVSVLIDYPSSSVIDKIFTSYYDQTPKLPADIDIPAAKLPTAEIITSIILPNVDNFDSAESALLTRLSKIPA